jgi:hypothetical protein
MEFESIRRIDELIGRLENGEHQDPQVNARVLRTALIDTLKILSDYIKASGG